MTAYQRLVGTELKIAAPLGSVPAIRLPDQPSGSDTRSALDQVALAAVTSGPCYVLFSGGRDSSLVLALATRAAREAGVPDPIPVTAVYPGDEEADESRWQDLVLQHLGITERIVLPVTDQRTTLGDLATRHLRRRGLVWPEAVHTQPLFFAQLDPGTVLTGEGGDAFLEAQRITPLYLLGCRRRLPSMALVRAAAEALSPRVVALREARRRLADPDFLPWLRPLARETLAVEEVLVRGPLRWDDAIRSLHRTRMNRLALDNADISAAEYGHRLRHPIADTSVVAALAHEGGAWGFRGRTNLFRRLGADLLPDVVLARRSKASFNTSRWGAREVAFAQDYAGGAFDPDYIDEERLRREWLSPRPHPVSYFLAQIAWLHHENLPLVPGEQQVA